jgi:hypothetical protein
MVVDDRKGGLDKYQHGAFGLQLRPGADSTTGPGETALRINAVQRYFIEHTRLGIPIIPFEERCTAWCRTVPPPFPGHRPGRNLGHRIDAAGRERDRGGDPHPRDPPGALAGAQHRERRAVGRVEETYGKIPGW